MSPDDPHLPMSIPKMIEQHAERLARLEERLAARQRERLIETLPPIIFVVLVTIAGCAAVSVVVHWALRQWGLV